MRKILISAVVVCCSLATSVSAAMATSLRDLSGRHFRTAG